MVAGGVVLIAERKRAMLGIPAVMLAEAIIVNKVFRSDRYGVWDTATSMSFGEIVVYFIVAYFLVTRGPNPIAAQAKQTILGGA